MKKFINRKIFAPLLAVMLLLSAAGCGQQTTTSEIVVWEDVEPSSSEGTGTGTDSGAANTGDASNAASTNNGSSTSGGSSKVTKPNNNASTGGSSNVTSSNSDKNNASTGGDSSKVTKPNGNTTTSNKNSQVKLPDFGTKGANGKDYSNYNPYKGIEKYKGTTVKFATWIDHSQDDMALAFEEFPEKYGIKVQSVYCTQNNYVQEVMALISAGNSPDIIVENGNYPSTFQIAQKFSVTGVDINEPFWDQREIKALSANGNVYFVNSVYTRLGGVCVYNEDLLLSNGIKTPGQYYKEGKWTFENARKVAQQTKALGSDYRGMSTDGAFLLGANNVQVIKFQNGKFVNNLTSEGVAEVYKWVSQIAQEDLLASNDDFTNGKAAMYIGGSYALKKTGYLRGMDGDALGYTYLPTLKAGQKAASTGFMRGYGIAKGSKNPKAAGMFIRYCLDPNNIDIVGDAFFDAKGAQFYFDSIKLELKKTRCVDYAQGVADYSGTWWGYWVRGAESPDQVAAALKSHEKEAQQCVDKANKYLASLK